MTCQKCLNTPATVWALAPGTAYSGYYCDYCLPVTHQILERLP